MGFLLTRTCSEIIVRFNYKKPSALCVRRLNCSFAAFHCDNIYVANTHISRWFYYIVPKPLSF